VATPFLIRSQIRQAITAIRARLGSGIVDGGDERAEH
jgi:hypothetical protein